MMKGLSNELIAILAVGAALAGVTLTGHVGLHSRVDRMEARLTARIDTVNAGLTARIDTVNAGLTARIDDSDVRLSERIDAGDGRLTGRLGDVEARLSSVEEKVTRLDALDIGPRLRTLESGQAALREAVARIEGLLRGLLERLSRDDPPDG